jgi:hypothetical protein
VKIFNSTNTLVKNTLTGNDGYVVWMDAPEYFKNLTAEIYYSPYNITAQKLSIKTFTDPKIYLTSSRTVKLYLYGDNDFDGIPDGLDYDDDNDGHVDTNDDFPYDPSEWIDTDSDGIGNNADPDDDNDGVPDMSFR